MTAKQFNAWARANGLDTRIGKTEPTAELALRLLVEIVDKLKKGEL